MASESDIIMTNHIMDTKVFEIKDEEEYWECPECRIVVPLSQQLLHLQEAHVEDPGTEPVPEIIQFDKYNQKYSCGLCMMVRNSYCSLMMHLGQAHQIYFCSACDFQPSDQTELDNHVQEEHMSLEGFYQCNLCCWVHRKRQRWFLHMRQHIAKGGELQSFQDPVQPMLAFPCLGCDWEATTAEEREIHIDMVHRQGEDGYGCTFCGLFFPDIASWTEHLILDHNVERPESPEKEIPFDEAADGFDFVQTNMAPLDDDEETLSAPSTAEIIEPTQILSFPCFGCPFEAEDTDARESHIHVNHKDGALFACPALGCDFKATMIASWTEHLLGVHNAGEEPLPVSISDEVIELDDFYKCGHCEWVGDSQPELDEHTEVVHRRRSKVMKMPPLTCAKCPFKSLFVHKLMWHEEREHDFFPCVACGHLAQNGEQRKLHMLAEHHRRGRFFCPNFDCKKRFDELKDYDKHMRRDHDYSRLLGVSGSALESAEAAKHCKTY